MKEFKKQLNKTAYQLTQKANKMQHKENKKVVYRAALLSVYGWQLAIPVLLGIVLGILLDKTFPISCQNLIALRTFQSGILYCCARDCLLHLQAFCLKSHQVLDRFRYRFRLNPCRLPPSLLV